MKKILSPVLLLMFISFCLYILPAQGQDRVVKKGTKYDTIIVKHSTGQAKKPAPKPVAKPAVVHELVLPVPEYMNQPYYYDKEGNKLIKLENATAMMITKKKTLGLKGAKQILSMDAASSKIRFTAKKDIVFFIKTSGDVIDLTSYIKVYKFLNNNEKREVLISSKDGLINDTEGEKGKQIGFSVKMISKDNYMIQFTETLEAGEYGFVWVKNMELQEFTVFAFAIDWKNSD